RNVTGVQTCALPIFSLIGFKWWASMNSVFMLSTYFSWKLNEQASQKSFLCFFKKLVLAFCIKDAFLSRFKCLVNIILPSGNSSRSEERRVGIEYLFR